jgi:hypothetical protein
MSEHGQLVRRVFESNLEKPTPTMSTQRSPVSWFEIYVQVMERAKAFYQNTFQVTLERLESPGLERT